VYILAINSGKVRRQVDVGRVLTGELSVQDWRHPCGQGKRRLKCSDIARTGTLVDDLKFAVVDIKEGVRAEDAPRGSGLREVLEDHEVIAYALGAQHRRC
jgi:hypothetical protein